VRRPLARFPAWCPLVCLLAAAAPPPAASAAGQGLPIDRLPETHDYQRQLRGYLATLEAEDFAVDAADFTVVEPADDEGRYRMWLLGLHPPDVAPLRVPADAFTLARIESQRGLRLPLAVNRCQPLAWLAAWDYRGNPYRGSRAVALRAFVAAAVDMVMLDHLHEHGPRGAARADYLGGNLIWLGATYAAVKDVLPAAPREAFAAGLAKHVRRIDRWGPKGLMTDMDLFAPVGLWYVQQALGDPEISRISEAYARRLFTEPRFFHPAGYFVDNDCFDTSYNGISLYFGTWAALASDWPFAQEAMRKAWRLRAHLCFPDPVGGGFSGPSHMSSRTSADPFRDQWNFPHRSPAAALVSDDAIHLAAVPTADELATATARLVAGLNARLAAPPAPERDVPWVESHWSNAGNFAHDHHRPGGFARLRQLEQEGSPLRQPLYSRPDVFIRQFDDAFVIGRFAGQAAAIHTGPVGRAVGHGGLPYGFGGGQLSTYWTPASGAVVVGRRRGVQGAVFDRFEEWREWPTHAVIGLTRDDELVHSARIAVPRITADVAAARAVVTASGTMPMYDASRRGVSPSGCGYERTFVMDEARLEVRTTVVSDGTQRFRELYETIPVVLRERPRQPATEIEFRVGGTWSAARPGRTAAVQAARLSRFSGSVLVAFDEPRTLHLGEQPWRDGYQTPVECCTLRIDLLDGRAGDGTIGTVRSGYALSPAAEPAD
jgi:hypothetical protein